MKKLKLFAPAEVHVGEDYIDIYGTNKDAADDWELEPRLLRVTGHPSDAADIDFANDLKKAINCHQKLVDALVLAERLIGTHGLRDVPMHTLSPGGQLLEAIREAISSLNEE